MFLRGDVYTELYGVTHQMAAFIILTAVTNKFTPNYANFFKLICWN